MVVCDAYYVALGELFPGAERSNSFAAMDQHATGGGDAKWVGGRAIARFGLDLKWS